MALTYGAAPFSPDSRGKYNIKEDLPETFLYWEDFDKRIRAVFNGEVIVDSRKAKALHETGQFMVLYFPREDVDMNLLQKSEYQTECPHKGTASYWSVQTGGRKAENAVWSYEAPIDSAAFLDGYMAFFFDKMDDWYQEDEKVYAHLRNPYHGFEILSSSQNVKVTRNGEVAAESSHPRILFETSLPPRYYLPAEDVRTDLLRKSDYVTQCPYKGDAQHWHLKMSGDTVEDAAWSLPEPIGEGRKVAGYFCFYPDKVQVEVDGKLLKK